MVCIGMTRYETNLFMMHEYGMLWYNMDMVWHCALVTLGIVCYGIMQYSVKWYAVMVC